jgi:hypothetical protein
MTPEIQMALVGVAVLVIGAVGRLIETAINRYTATIAIENAKGTARDLVEAAMSDATEGEIPDEGGAIQIAETYLRESVGGSIAKLGGNPASIAAGLALGVIAKLARK